MLSRAAESGRSGSTIGPLGPGSPPKSKRFVELNGVRVCRTTTGPCEVGSWRTLQHIAMVARRRQRSSPDPGREPRYQWSGCVGEGVEFVCSMLSTSVTTNSKNRQVTQRGEEVSLILTVSLSVPHSYVGPPPPGLFHTSLQLHRHTPPPAPSLVCAS